MIEDQKVDLGSVQIHKKVLADITFSAISEIEGVKLIPQDLTSKFLRLFKTNNYSGIIVTVDKNNQVSIEVKVCIRYGINIPDIARNVQDAIRAAVEKIADINLKDVNINIQGIQREDS